MPASHVRKGNMASALGSKKRPLSADTTCTRTTKKQRNSDRVTSSLVTLLEIPDSSSTDQLVDGLCTSCHLINAIFQSGTPLGTRMSIKFQGLASGCAECRFLYEMRWEPLKPSTGGPEIRYDLVVSPRLYKRMDQFAVLPSSYPEEVCSMIHGKSSGLGNASFPFLTSATERSQNVFSLCIQRWLTLIR
jgi:hypothetical protein